MPDDASVSYDFAVYQAGRILGGVLMNLPVTKIAMTPDAWSARVLWRRAGLGLYDRLGFLASGRAAINFHNHHMGSNYPLRCFETEKRIMKGEMVGHGKPFAETVIEQADAAMQKRFEANDGNLYFIKSCASHLWDLWEGGGHGASEVFIASAVYRIAEEHEVSGV